MQLKVDVINGAYSQLKISGLTVDPTPEDIEVALSRLESMMHELASRNIDVGYNFEESPNPNSPTNADLSSTQMMEANLALRLIPDFGKVADPVLVGVARSSMAAISSVSARKFIKSVDYPSRMPRGSGSTQRYNRWQRFYRETPEAPSNSNTNYLNIGDVNDYLESFAQYLGDGESISSYSITADTHLTISNDSISGDGIAYTVTVDANATDQFQSVVVQVTTDANRVASRQINFNIAV
ncbi:MAG: packaged DNA stabilization gp4 family protein [Rickettsiales bacterium]